MSNSYDLIVVGGGSGGMAAAKRAAGYGAKVAVCEFNRWGGTCVNVGCVPKKMMWWASSVKDFIEESKEYGHSATYGGFDWEYMKSRRDYTINRLNGIYQTGLKNLDIEMYNDLAQLTGKDSTGKQTVKVGETVISASQVLLAPGGFPTPLNIPGGHLAITSDGFFSLDSQPHTCAVIGAGYIAVELAQVLQGLGTDISLFCRGLNTLRTFDKYIQEKFDAAIRRQGVKMFPESTPKSIEKRSDGSLYYTTMNDIEYGPFDCILCATGRSPRVDNLGLVEAGVALTDRGLIAVDEWQKTSADGIYALGDVTDAPQLTPVAIATARRLADKLYGGVEDSKADYKDVPTVVFTHPPIGTIGLTEEQAAKEFGQDNLEIYTSVSVNLYYSAFDMAPSDKPRIYMKMICNKLDQERIVGLHCIGMGVDEFLQGFGIAFKMGATKNDLDKVCAIHPTAAEEMVTMDPWGMTKTQMNALKEKSKSQFTKST
eukprot:GHVH01001325.1.p1 GENE.GHVH01001325.1~~GHVH01001325.1.p1  ORF type:complete len:513 (+),score=70.77 GHVH01001325.1:86-1540(+)